MFVRQLPIMSIIFAFVLPFALYYFAKPFIGGSYAAIAGVNLFILLIIVLYFITKEAKKNK